MKNCSEIRLWMYRYIDQELTAPEHDEFCEHLANCPDCREELEKIKLFMHECEQVEEVELPANFKSELHEKLVQIRSQEIKRKEATLLRNRYIRVISTVAACFTVLLVSYGLLGTGWLEQNKAGTNEMRDGTEMRSMAGVTQETTAASYSAADSFVSPDPDIKGKTASKPADAEFGMMKATESPAGRGMDSQARISAVAGQDAALNSYIVFDQTPQNEAEKIRQLAMENGAIFENVDTVALTSGEASEGFKGENIDKVLNFRLPSDKVDQFTESLVRNYSTENVLVEVSPAISIQFNEAMPVESTEATSARENEQDAETMLKAGSRMDEKTQPVNEEDFQKKLNELDRKILDTADPEQKKKLEEERQGLVASVKGLSGGSQEWVPVMVTIKAEK